MEKNRAHGLALNVSSKTIHFSESLALQNRTVKLNLLKISSPS